MRIEFAGQVALQSDAGVVPAERLRRPAWVALAYLAAERHRPICRDELAEVLWGDAAPSSWDTIVRGLVSKLRGVLDEAGAGRDALTTAFGCYQLRLPAEAVIDVDEAAGDVAAAEAALAAGDPVRARATASRAAEVASRRFLPGAEGAWVERRQAELADLRLRALEALAQACSACDDHVTAVRAADEVVALAPLRESGHLRLLAAHAAAGNRAEALRAYERCRRIVVEELGVSPSPAVEAAYIELLEDDRPVARRKAPRPLPAALTRQGPALVGRRDALEQLAGAWKRAVTGVRQVVFVGGEPGIGKTRLVAELSHLAHTDGGQVLYGRCHEDLAAPYEPLADVVRQAVTLVSGEDLAASLRDEAGELARLAPELALQLARTPPPASPDAAVARVRLAEAVDALLVTVAAAGPVTVVLDDLHWAREPALGVLRRLVRSPTGASVLVVGTYRHTELQPPDPLSTLLADTRRDPGVGRLLLDGIGPDDVLTLVEASVGSALGEPGSRLAGALHAHTRGNPFFVGEVLRHLVRNGHVPEAEELVSAVPEGVRETITRRLLRLSPETNQLLAGAAVVGAEFDVALLEAMGTSRDDVLDAVEEGLAAGLLEETGFAGRYGFAHALVRNTIYDQLGSVRRTRLHRRVGHALEHLHGRHGRHVAQLAQHFCKGAPAGDAVAAADYALAAARAAVEQLAFEEAIAHLRAGLAALDSGKPDQERRWKLLIGLAMIQGRVLDVEDRRRTCESAADLARRHGSPERLAVVAMVRADCNPFTWRDPGAVELCDEALAAIGDSSASLRARLLCSRLYVTRDRPRAHRHEAITTALDLARQSGDANALRRALGYWCIHLKVSARRNGYLLMAEAVDELLSLPAPVSDDPLSWGLVPAFGPERVRGFRADARLGLGDRAGLDADLDKLERAVLRSDSIMAAEAASYRSLLALSDGRFEEAEDLCRRAQAAMLRAMGQESADLTRLHHLFRLRREQGRLAEFEPEMASAVDRYPHCRSLRPMLALARAELGDLAGAQEALARLAPDARRPTDAVAPVWPPVWLLFVSELAAELDDAGVAAGAYEHLLPHADVFTFPAWSISHLGATDHYLGMLATVLGRWDEAEAHFQTALRLQEAMGARALVARTQFWQARMAVRQGDERRAGTVLDEVGSDAAALGMTGLGRQVGALTSTGRLQAPRTVRGKGALGWIGS